jgi:hypothetical protein
MDKLILCIRNDSDEIEIEECTELLDKVNVKHQIDYSILNTSYLDEQEGKELRSKIRGVAIDGISVKSKGTGPLPISRKGDTFGKICTLLHYKDSKLKAVYPHSKNNKRNDIVPYLKKLIDSDDVNGVFDSDSISEGDIARIISTFPEFLEEGLEFDDVEVDTKDGRIDAVFKTPDDEHLLIEIELEAKDNAIGQVQRFKLAYSEKYDVPEDKIRLGIVCAKISDSRVNACKGAGIEVYKLCLERIA